MRLFSIALIAGVLGLVGAAKDASATVTITMEWSGCGGGAGGCTATGGQSISVDVGGGQTLRLDIYLTHDITTGGGIGAHTFSLNFDTSLDNELNLGPMAQTEWAGSDVDPGPANSQYGPLTTGLTTRESTAAQAGRINSFESGGLIDSLPANGLAYTVGTATATAPARYRVGQAFFTVNIATNDGADIFSGAFNGLFDVSIDGSNNVIPNSTFIFHTATVNLSTAIPEPGTVSLLGLGLVGLVLASRRRF